VKRFAILCALAAVPVEASAAPLLQPHVLGFAADGRPVQTVTVADRDPTPLEGLRVLCRFFDAHAPLEEIAAPVPTLAPGAAVDLTLAYTHLRTATHTQCRLGR
jgi:hypothetical protein